MIKKSLLKPMCTLSPVLLEIHSEIASDYHSSSVWHEASRVHVSHQCINKGHSCLTLSPPFDNIIHILPVVVRPVIYSILREVLVSVSHEPESIEVSPEEFINIHLGRFICAMLLFKLPCLVIDIPD